MENEQLTTEQTSPKSTKKAAVWFYSKKVIRSVCFFLVVGILLYASSYALMPKNNSRKHGMRNENSVGFYAEPPGSIDVFFVGNSNNYSSFSPIEMWREYGFQAYTSGVGKERVVESYLYLKDLLKYHHPKVIVVETDSIFLKMDTMERIGDTVEKLACSVFPVFLYHDRWKTVYFGEMFRSPEYTWHASSHGQYISGAVKPYTGKRTIKKTDKAANIDLISYYYLNAIISLCKENNIELLFTYAPCAKAWNYTKHNAVQRFADEKGVPFIDLNLIEKELKLDWRKDTRDKGMHLNVYGAKKVSHYMGKYLTEHYQLKDLRGNKELDKRWEEDYQAYLLKTNETKNQTK